MERQKPMGMRIGESVFCAGYLLFALVAGLMFLGATGRGGATGAFAATCCAMTLLLGCGDAFHLVPRILINIQGATRDAAIQKRRTLWLGLGNLVSSITMTFFYVLLPIAMWQATYLGNNASWERDPRMPALRTVVLGVLVAFGIVRALLCLHPKNRWFDGGDARWGIYRNIPFVAMGIVTVLYLVGWYNAWLMAALVVASFACYLGVVLFARSNPVLGMLMIPKTVCYIWLIAILLSWL